MSVTRLHTSLVNILLVRELSKYFVDDNGHFDETGTTTKTGYAKSTFVWDFNRYTQTFHNSDKGLPKIAVNEGNLSFKHYINMIGHYIADKVEANFFLVFLNVIERDDLSNEGVLVNEGSQNEGAQVSEGDIEHSPIIGGMF